MINTRSVIILLFGVLIGFFVYNQLGNLIGNQSNDTASSLVDSAVAAPTIQSSDVNKEISETRKNAITRAVNRVSPAVISVNVTKIQEFIQRSPFSADPFLREFFPELFRDRRIQQQKAIIGSGFIISEDGYVVTNEHVVEHATELIISMSDGREFDAELVGSDHISDIALLKIEGEDFSYIELGNSDQLLIGEWAIALGNPFGLFVKRDPTVTVGVISAVNRDFGYLEERVYQDMIQTDASINTGNSGGPLCNAEGKAIGMNTFIFTGERYSRGSVGIGFAIPANRLKRIIEELRTHKEVDRDFWLGVYYSNLNRFVARELGYESQNGVYVARLDRGGPGDEAGLRLGDIIAEINGVTIRNVEDVENAVFSSYPKVGDILEMKVWREDRFIDIQVRLEKRENQG